MHKRFRIFQKKTKPYFFSQVVIQEARSETLKFSVAAAGRERVLAAFQIELGSTISLRVRLRF